MGCIYRSHYNYRVTLRLAQDFSRVKASHDSDTVRLGAAAAS